MIFLDKARYIRVEREVRSTEEAHAHSARQAKEHPQRGDAAGIRNHLDGFGGHEAHENMRLPEVTESPCQKTDDADNRLTFHHVEHARVDFCQTCCRRRKAARVVHDGNRGDDECNAHDGRLNGVGPADREEAADEHVKNRRCRTNDECGFVFHVEGVFKEAGPCYDA